jgi:MFS transporter, MHS family, alpha-ketoglutarate permease
MTANLSEATHYTTTNRQRIMAIIKASSGNLIEWFCFYVYAFTGLYFSSAFFGGNRSTQLLQIAGVYAVGFLARPLGGWFFGRLADQQGRRVALLQSGWFMFWGSLLMAVVPDYASIGLMAPICLLVARLLQGLSVGGDYGTSATYMSEMAVKNRRGFFSSFQYTTLIGGQLLALLSVAVLEYILSESQLRNWGWRIPLGLGALGALFSVYLRYTLHETANHQSKKDKDAGSLKQLWQYKSAVITVLGITAAGSLCFYAFTTYMQKYLVNSVGLSTKVTNIIMSLALFVCMGLQPVFGALSDRIGRRNQMIIFFGLMSVSALPIFYTLINISNPYIAFLIVLLTLVILSLYTSAGGIIKAELFPAKIRALGVGFMYGIANALFGGTAEYAALQAKYFKMEQAFYWYVASLCVIGFLVAIRMPDLRKHGYLRD